MDERLKKHGAISWSELLTSDVQGARSFYAELFGWTYEDAPMDDGSYTLVKVNGEEVAGMMPTPPDAGPMPPAWGIYVTVDDVDASAEKAVAWAARFICLPRIFPRSGVSVSSAPPRARLFP